MNFKNVLHWALRITAALILLQTLYFKLTGQPESVELFTKLVGKNFEMYARIGTGIIELIAGVLLLIPKTTIYGAALGVGLMSGAILSHLAVIGIQSQGDGGQLFTLAIIVLISCLILLFLEKQKLFTIINSLIKFKK